MTFEMNRLLTSLLLAFLVMGCAASIKAQTQPPFKVGVAQELITPCTPALLAGNYCRSGYIQVDENLNLSGAGNTNNATSVDSDLLVQALAIEEVATGRRMVLVSIDVGVLEFSFIKEVRDQVTGYHGLRPEGVLINASHTHSAPSMHLFCPGLSCPDNNSNPNIENARPNVQYVAGVKTKLIATIKQALDNLTPASLFFGSSTSNIGKYRRYDAGLLPLLNQFCIPQGDPSQNLPYPQRLDVFEARDSQGKVIATAFFVASHPVYMTGVHQVSADFIAPARTYVAGQLSAQGSPAAMAMFFQGFGGDLNPRLFGVGNQVQTGNELGADVMRARTIMTTPLTGPLQVRSQIQYLALDPSFNFNTGYPYSPATTLPTEVQTLTVGNGANAWNLVAFSNEMVSQYANYVRNSWPNPARVTLAGYSNGVQSYVPNERVYRLDRINPPPPGSPVNFEGYWTFAYYGIGAPAWTNGDLLSLPRGGSGGAYSLSLNGTGAHFKVPANDNFNVTGSLTLEAWVNTTANGTQQGVIERFGPYNSGSGGYDLRLTPEGKVHFFIGYDSDNANLYDILDGDTTVTPGVWHHLAAVYDGTSMKVYLDGQLDGQKTTSRTPGTGASNLIIGARGNDAAGGFFNGLIDEVRVTSNAVYNANFIPEPRLTAVPGMRGLWKFTGQSVKDFAVLSNHGLLINNATYSTNVPRDPAPSTDNYSLLLNLASAYVEVPDSSSLNITGSLTLEAWVKTSANGTQQGVIERFGPYNSGSGGYNLRLTPEGKVHFFIGYDSDDANLYDFLDGGTTVSPGVWHHLAAVYNGTQMRVFLDGQLDGQKTTSKTPGTGTSHLIIGARGNDAGRSSLNGLIDEVRVTASAVYSGTFVPEAHLSSLTGTRGLWKFDGKSTRDLSGNNNDLTLIGGAAYSADVPPNAVNNNSLQLNGAGAHFKVPSSDGFNVTGSLTLEAWVKTTSNGAQQGVIERFGPFNSSSGGYDLRLTPQGKVHFFIGYDSSDPNLYDTLAGGTTASPGVWHHVAAVYDGTEMRVYLDGKLDGHKTTTKKPGVGISDLIIGARGYDALGGFFNGLIDEVRVTADAVYTCDFVTPQHLLPVSGTRALWKFDGQSTQDSSGNGNTGSLVGGAVFSSNLPSN